MILQRKIYWAVGAIGKISPRPVFLIDDLEDDAFPSDSVEVLYEAAGDPKVLWQITEAPHGNGWETAPEEYERRVLAFWRKTFGIVESEPPEGIGSQKTP